MSLKEDALEIIDYAIKSADPYTATKELLESLDISGDEITVLSIGKAAVPMARACEDVYASRIKKGLLVTKYKHIGDFKSNHFNGIESGHPISDENSIIAAERGLELCRELNENDVCIILVSGGGSALFEKSIIPADMQRAITKKLLSSGAEINCINAIRRRISLVKGGKLAAVIYPAKVYTIALSDVLNNDRSAIASGLTVKDTTTDDEVFAIIDKYISEYKEYLAEYISTGEEIKINDGGYYFAGDINSLCSAAYKKAEELGYTAIDGSRQLEGEAREVCKTLIKEIDRSNKKSAYIFGGETTVTLKGNGLGGRNQEMALQGAILLKNESDIVFASAGSDGTDGPTDAAGGIVDGNTYNEMLKNGINPENELENNNSNYALSQVGALIKTGPTGTNVNDLTIILTE